MTGASPHRRSPVAALRPPVAALRPALPARCPADAALRPADAALRPALPARRSLPRLLRHAAVLCVLALGSTASASDVVLHKYFAPNPEEDLRLGATTHGGSLPAALDTASGVVPAPTNEPNPTEPAMTYGPSSTPDSSDASYRIDRNTTRPDVVSYDDPFTPAITPFKRLFAYDTVDSTLELVVSSRKLEQLAVGAGVLAAEDEFYGDLTVELSPGAPVRVPSVGPGAHIVAATTEPSVDFTFHRDRADNWFIQTSERRRVRVLLHLAIPRAVFGSTFANVDWEKLRARMPALPPEAQQAGNAVLERLGVSRRIRPRAAVTLLVDHFRSFAPSPELPTALSGAALYQELALSKKGVCRHRAYAFTITALALGIPTRMVRNEAHAWVEVWDGAIWHRVDLGGAAGRLDVNQDSRTTPHRPPSDPYSWPEGSESGSALAERTAQTSSGPQNNSNGPGATPGASADRDSAPSPQAPPSAPPSGVPVPDDSAPNLTTPDTPTTPPPPTPSLDPLEAPIDEPQDPEDPEETSARDERPPAELELTVATSSVSRGASLDVHGRVRAGGQACTSTRVDINLVRKSHPSVFIGAVPSDDQGRFQGRVTIPFEIDVGDYQVLATTPGNATCGPPAAK